MQMIINDDNCVWEFAGYPHSSSCYSFIIIIISTINIIIKMSHQKYGPFLMQESEFGDLMLQYDLKEVNFCDFRFTLSDIHPPLFR